MIESVEQFGSELQLPALGDLECLDKPQVEIPVVRRHEDVTTRAVLAGSWNCKRACIFEKDWPDNARFVLQLRLDRGQHDSAGNVTGVRRAPARRGGAVAAAIYA